jgi:hypothetical protein
MVADGAKGSPIAAGLIAFRLGLLASSLIPAGRPEQRAVHAVKDAAEPALQETHRGRRADRAEPEGTHPAALGEVRATAADPRRLSAKGRERRRAGQGPSHRLHGYGADGRALSVSHIIGDQIRCGRSETAPDFAATLENERADCEKRSPKEHEPPGPGRGEEAVMSLLGRANTLGAVVAFARSPTVNN